VEFGFNDDQELLRETTRRFLEERHPLEALRPCLEAESTFDRDVWRGGAELGWTSMLVPPEQEGGSISEQPVVDLAGIAEELGRGLYPGPFLATNVVADAIASSGDEHQRKEYLGPIAGGHCVAAWCLTGDGTPDLEAVEVTASTSGDDLRLEGVARYVHDAHHADLLLVACHAPAGPTLALVSLPDEDVTTRVLSGLDLTRRFCEVRFEGALVSAHAVLGEVGRAEPAIERCLRLATVLQSCEAVGAAQRLFEATVQHAKDRVQFGRPIGSFQAIKHKLADLLIELEGARSAAYFAALAVADARDDRDLAVAAAGATVRGAAALVAGEAVQIHGGVGFTWEYDVHLFLRRAEVDQLLLGDAAWHRERLCRLVEASLPEDD
jgi:alkylation response protein AidB-like acyl-CoA dehydrogenase